MTTAPSHRPDQDATTRPRRIRLRAAAVVATMACGGAAALVTGQAFAGDAPTELRSGRHPGRPAAPAVLAPPDGMVPVARYKVAEGTQNYVCTGGVFVFKAPEALLVRGAKRSIHHYAGPTWESNQDGSLITAAKVAESPVPGAIPELLLEVRTHGGDPDGELAEVAYIQRLRTGGGVTPTGPCTEGAVQAVPYQADYVFFAPR
jgi:hypothetical protein